MTPRVAHYFARRLGQVLLFGLLFLSLTPPSASAQVVDPALRQQAFEDYWAGRLEVAREGFAKVLEANPEDHEATLAVARMAYWSGDTVTAVPLYEKYLKAQPFDLDAKTEYCRCLSWEGRVDETEACASSVVALEKENLEANLILASALRAKGKHQEADRVIRWVLTLDPTNQDARSVAPMTVSAPRPPTNAVAAGQVAPAPQAEGPLRYRLHSESSYEGDNFEYRGFSSLLGFTAAVTDTFSLDPRLLFLASSDSKTNEPVVGFGAGLQAIWAATPVLSFTGQGHYVPLTTETGIVDAWDLGLMAQLGVAEGLSLWVGAQTVLHGTDRQSSEALAQEIRRNDLQGGLYFENERFRLTATGAYGFLRDGSKDLGATSSWWLSPALKLPVPNFSLVVGYGLWGTYYRQEAPALAWWSPAIYVSHTLFLEAVIPMDQQWSVEASIAGGIGQEQRREIPNQLSSYWQSAAIGNGRLALVYKVGESFDLAFGGAFGVSSRQNKKTVTTTPATVPGGVPTVTTTGGDVSTYQHWQLFLNAGGRF
jgi:tetratricopeptide (TPR) repeat protein